MSEEMLKCRVISATICAMYNKLTRLSTQNRDDSKEYKETISLLKKIIPIEIEQYKELTDEEANSWYERLSKIEIKPQIEDRIHNRLKEQIAIREGHAIHDGILLATAITGKIMIDVFKDLYHEVIELFFNEELEKEEFDMMLTLFKTFKFNYLSVSNYLELKCLQCDFDLDRIKSESFRDIENRYRTNFVENSRNIFFNYVVEAIKEIKDMNYDNAYLTGFLSMFEVSRVKVMLKYLDRESLHMISDYYNNGKFNYQENVALVKVKKLIDDRKRELH